MSLSKKNNKIGGEFYLDNLNINKSSNQFDDLLKGFETEFFTTGRGALSYLLNQHSGKSVLLPAYICQSIIKVFNDHSFNIEFYDINKDLTINMVDFEKKCKYNIDIVFFINYFGQLQPESTLSKIKELSKLKKFTIIEDTTHSIFSKIKTIGDYCIASLRKWTALPDGAVLYTDTSELKKQNIKYVKNSFSELRVVAMLLKGIYKTNKIDKDENYQKLFHKAEKNIDKNSKIVKMTKLSRQILECGDIQKLIEKRKQNYNHLEQNLDNTLIKKALKPSDFECNLFLPIYVKNRDKFRKYLSKNSIYCPIHWPIEEESLLKFDNINYISKNIISLPIDQRYDLLDMDFICDVINKYKG